MTDKLKELAEAVVAASEAFDGSKEAGAALDAANAEFDLAASADAFLDLYRERDEALAYVKDATVAITELTSGGSEFFGKRIAGVYTADLPFCVQRIRETRAGLFEQVRQSKREQKAAEAALSSAQEEVERLRGDNEFLVASLKQANERANDLARKLTAALTQEPTDG